MKNVISKKIRLVRNLGSMCILTATVLIASSCEKDSIDNELLNDETLTETNPERKISKEQFLISKMRGSNSKALSNTKTSQFAENFQKSSLNETVQYEKEQYRFAKPEDFPVDIRLNKTWGEGGSFGNDISSQIESGILYNNLTNAIFPGAGRRRHIRAYEHSHGSVWAGNFGHKMWKNHIKNHPERVGLKALTVKNEVLELTKHDLSPNDPTSTGEYTIKKLGSTKPFSNLDIEEGIRPASKVGKYLYQSTSQSTTSSSRSTSKTTSLGVSLNLNLLAGLPGPLGAASVNYGFSKTVTESKEESYSKTDYVNIEYPHVIVPIGCECKFQAYSLTEKQSAKLKVFSSLEGDIIVTRPRGPGKNDTKVVRDGAKYFYPKVSFKRDGKNVSEYGNVSVFSNTQTESVNEAYFECINLDTNRIYRRNMPEGEFINWRSRGDVEYLSDDFEYNFDPYSN